ncbi:MAG TPA: copper transporter, partial [Bacillota bacterium]
RQQLSEQQAALEAVAAMAVQGRLSGQTVWLIEVGQVAPALRRQVETVLEVAGARVWTLPLVQPGSPSLADGPWSGPEVPPAAVLLVYGAGAPPQLPEPLRDQLRSFVSAGVPVIAAGDVPSATSELGQGVHVAQAGDLTRFTEQVRLVLALAGDRHVPDEWLR